MEWFNRLFQHDLWANERILGCCEQLSTEQLTTPVEGMFGPIGETFSHLLGVQEGYLELMGGRPEDDRVPARGVRDLEAIRQRIPVIGAQYDLFTRSLDEGLVQREFRIPWFERDLSVADGLLQVINHSTEHRSDLAGALTRLGITTPPLDYVFFVLGLED
jgi:uncharacterized damage-inducible protein DinB